MFLVVLESENKEQSNRPPTCELAGKGGVGQGLSLLLTAISFNGCPGPGQCQQLGVGWPTILVWEEPSRVNTPAPWLWERPLVLQATCPCSPLPRFLSHGALSTLPCLRSSHQSLGAPPALCLCCAPQQEILPPVSLAISHQAWSLINHPSPAPCCRSVHQVRYMLVDSGVPTRLRVPPTGQGMCLIAAGIPSCSLGLYASSASVQLLKDRMVDE